MLTKLKDEIKVEPRPVKFEKHDTHQIPSRVPSTTSKTPKGDSSKRNRKTHMSSIETSTKKRKSHFTGNQYTPIKPTSRSREAERQEYKKKFTDLVLNKNEIKSEINDSIANEWSKILKTGLPTNYKEALLKKQTIPDNCPLLKAPTLNLEVLRFVNKKHVAKRTDTARADKQDQLALGMTAVGKGLSLLAEDGSNKDMVIEASSFIHQGCKILADLHYSETIARREDLNLKPGMTALFDHERDDTLLGRGFHSRLNEYESLIIAAKSDNDESA